MTKLIPALNVQNFDEFKSKINYLYPQVKHFHFDLATLEFCQFETFPDIFAVERLNLKVTFDLHLMDFFQPTELLKYNKSYIKSVIFHPRGTLKISQAIKILKKIKKKIFLAFDLEENFNNLEILRWCDGFLFLGVKPGKSGQQFNEEILEKVKFYLPIIKKLKKKIGFDGGLTEETLPLVLKFKPHFIVMGKAIYDSPQPLNYYFKFLNYLKKL